jgi:hypothetical protein
MSENKINIACNKALGWVVSRERTMQCGIPVLWKGEDAYVNFEIRDCVNDWTMRPQMLSTLTPEQKFEIVGLVERQYKSTSESVQKIAILDLDQSAFAKLFAKVKGLIP